MIPRTEKVEPDILRRFEFWLPFLAGLHIMILFHAAQWYAYAIFAGDPSHPLRYVRWSMELWYSRAALAPLAIYIALRYRFEFKHWFRYLVTYSAITLIIGALCSALQVVVVGRLGTEKFFFSTSTSYYGQVQNSVQLTPFEKALVKGWPHLVYNMFTCWMLIGLVQGICYYRDAQEKKSEGAELRAQLAIMRLEALRMQLNPHFLFNTLHAISTLIEEDPRAAEEMLLRLSHLLRSILNGNHMQEIPLRNELKFLESHLAIERARFGDRLATDIRVAAGLMDCAVPQLVLQPLVENAIQHGIGRHAGSDLIEIIVSQQYGLLHLDVKNANGRLEQSSDDCLKSGIGLSNTRQRLKALYKEDADICLSNLTPTGVKVSVTLPLREMKEEQTSASRFLLQ